MGYNQLFREMAAAEYTSLMSYGTEIQLQSNLKKLLGNYWPDRMEISWLFVDLSKEEADFISYYILDNLRNKINISLMKKIGQRIIFDFRVNYQQREGTFTSFKNGNWGSETPYDPFWLFDSKITWQSKNINFFASANNIFNTSYHDIGNVIQPGRIIKLGVSVNVNID